MSSTPELSRTRLLAWTVKSAAIVAAMSYLAAHWLSTAPLDQSGLARLAAGSGRGVTDPTTTGSTSRRVDAARLDPCTAPPRS